MPLADPAKAAVVSRANIFAGLKDTTSHGASEADKEAVGEGCSGGSRGRRVHREESAVG